MAGRAGWFAASSSPGSRLIWAAAVDPADVDDQIGLGRIHTGIEQAMTPISHALPADPPPWRTSARSPAVRTRPVASTAAGPGQTPPAAGRRRGEAQS